MGASFHAKLLATKVFLEGQEVPCTSVQVRGGMKSPCTASIEIPYTDAAHKLAPRTLVHVFCMDSRYQSGLIATTAYARAGDSIATLRGTGGQRQTEGAGTGSRATTSTVAWVHDELRLREQRLARLGGLQEAVEREEDLEHQLVVLLLLGDEQVE